MPNTTSGSITDVRGIKVGHATNKEAMTGCTVILCEDGAIAGVDARGTGASTRQTDDLHPLHVVQRIHAVVLAGGSGYGLAASTGVMKYLEEKDVGLDMQVAKVPIAPAAIIFDLNVGSANVRPDAEMGYTACLNASSTPPKQGNYGAGTGATVGKLLGQGWMMKGGIGTASVDAGGGVIVGAIAVVNSIGDVIEPNTGNIIAGTRSMKKGPITIGDNGYFANSLQLLRNPIVRAGLKRLKTGESTVIGVVATNAAMTKIEATKVAQMAHDGLARTIKPAHLMFDGDTIFALSSGKKKSDVNIIGAFAAEAFSHAIIQAVLSAEPIDGFPSAAEAKRW